ncbi:MAG TPA: hypothetical protein VM052_03185, partial [Candidatus Limnocylindrales bacterium]|nr:hypothetical protein [Candidatus Limnocylindrales bacterium]
SRADGELKKQGDAQVDAWKKQAAAGQTVFGAVVRRTSITPASDVVGKELAIGVTSFDLTVNGTATGYTVPNTEPRATTVERLSAAADAGHDIDRDTAVVEVVGPPIVEADGVHWRLRAHAAQFKRIDQAAIRAALAGRQLEDVPGVISDRGLRLVRVSTWPGWWPRLPVLDDRIAIESDTPAASAP